MSRSPAVYWANPIYTLILSQETAPLSLTVVCGVHTGWKCRRVEKQPGTSEGWELKSGPLILQGVNSESYSKSAAIITPYGTWRSLTTDSP